MMVRSLHKISPLLIAAAGLCCSGEEAGSPYAEWTGYCDLDELEAATDDELPRLLLSCDITERIADVAGTPGTLRSEADRTGFMIGTLGDRPGGASAAELAEHNRILQTEFNFAPVVTGTRWMVPECPLVGADPDCRLGATEEAVFADDALELQRITNAIAVTQARDQQLFGSTVIYKNDGTPSWLGFPPSASNEPCDRYTKPQLLAIMKQIVQGLVAAGGPDVWIWKLVNESELEQKPTKNNCWSRVIAADEPLGRNAYVAYAFQFAREIADQIEAAHGASRRPRMMINEAFGVFGVDPPRAAAFFDKLDEVRAVDGVRIDVVGIQTHLEIANDTRRDEVLRLRDGTDDEERGYVYELRRFMDEVEARGMDVLISELDVYQGPSAGVTSGELGAKFIEQAEVYYRVAKVCRDHPACLGIHTWGMRDDLSWVLTRPFDPHPDALPLYYSVANGHYRKKYCKKPAYWGLFRALWEAGR